MEQRDNLFIATQRFGDCDDEEKENSLYRDLAIFRTDATQFTFATYNVSIVSKYYGNARGRVAPERNRTNVTFEHSIFLGRDTTKCALCL